MAVPGPAFQNVPGTPASPIFAQIVVKAQVAMANGTTNKDFNVFNFRRRVSGGTIDETALFDAFKAVVLATWQAAAPAIYVPTQTTVRFMDDPTRNGVDCGTLFTTGSRTGDTLPLQQAVSFQIKTNGRGRSYRGGKHFGPVSEDDTTKDDLTGTGLANWNALASAMASGLNAMVDANGQTYDLIVLSQVLSDFTVNPSLFTGAYMTNVVANVKVGSMLRRKERSAA